MLNVKTDEIYNKNNIENSNDLRKHIVNIDSRFRKSSLEPPTDYLYEFAHPYKNVIKARICSVELPNGFYNFSKAKRNTMFRIDARDISGVLRHITVQIEEGDYNSQGIVDAIQDQFDELRDLYGLFFEISLNQITRKVTISFIGTAPAPNPTNPTNPPTKFGITFVMLGYEDRKYDFGLGYNLGFNNHFYCVEGGVGVLSITGESLINVAGDPYLLLGIDDMYTVEQKTSNDYIQCLGKILIKRSREGIIFDDGYTVLSNDIIFPRPMDLKQVRIKLMDAYGIGVELNNLNFSLSLEIMEVMNVQMYDYYRNYLWNKSEPRAKQLTNGSATPIAYPGRNYN